MSEPTTEQINEFNEYSDDFGDDEAQQNNENETVASLSDITQEIQKVYEKLGVYVNNNDPLYARIYIQSLLIGYFQTEINNAIQALQYGVKAGLDTADKNNKDKVTEVLEQIKKEAVVTAERKIIDDLNKSLEYIKKQHDASKRTLLEAVKNINYEEDEQNKKICDSLEKTKTFNKKLLVFNYALLFILVAVILFYKLF